MKLVPFILGSALLARATFAYADENDVATARACIDAFERGQSAEAQGKLIDARRFYGEGLLPLCPDEIRRVSARRADAVDARTPTVSVAVRDAYGRDVDVRVAIDGDASLVPGRTRPVDPGLHIVQISSGSGDAHEERFIAYEGEKARVVVIPWGGPVTPPSAPQIPTVTRERSLVAPLVVGSAGVLALIGAGAVLAVSASEAEERDKQFRLASTDPQNGGAHQDSALSHDRASRTDEILGMMLGIGGIASVGLAVGLYLYDGGATRMGVAPMVGPGTAGAAFHRAF